MAHSLKQLHEWVLSTLKQETKLFITVLCYCNWIVSIVVWRCGAFKRHLGHEGSTLMHRLMRLSQKWLMLTCSVLWFSPQPFSHIRSYYVVHVAMLCMACGMSLGLCSSHYFEKYILFINHLGCGILFIIYLFRHPGYLHLAPVPSNTPMSVFLPLYSLLSLH